MSGYWIDLSADLQADLEHRAQAMGLTPSEAIATAVEAWVRKPARARVRPVAPGEVIHWRAEEEAERDPNQEPWTGE